MKRIIVATVVFFSVVSILADDDEFLVKPEDVAEELPVEPANKEIKDESHQNDSSKSSAKPKTRKCFKCLGKGVVTVNVSEPCERCDGTGILISEVELDDTRHYWYAAEKTKRKSLNKQPCPRCKRRGKLPIKKEIECSVCKGSGLLYAKTGSPVILPKDAPESDKVAETDKSMADRIRERIRESQGPAEVTTETGKGSAMVDLREHGGRLIINGCGTSFVTRWSPCGDKSVYAYPNTREDLIAPIRNKHGMPASKSTFESLDWSKRSLRVETGSIVVLMNKEGRFLAVFISCMRTKNGERIPSCFQIEYRIY